MSRFSWLPPLLGIFALLSLTACYSAVRDAQQTVSPQGCRMSWMYPSYIRQDQFTSRRSPPANPYSLWLYRESGWDDEKRRGLPVLFIPGNAGSSQQVRSIASSATRQFYSEPNVVAPEYSSRLVKPLDFFAVEFNEDLSGLHGPTIGYQVAYTTDAISYILSQYPANTSIIVIGHSMGGVVATALLPSPNISAIITLSTPHTLPPARVDARMDKIYQHNLRNLLSDPTPILSICGGAADNMILSESCILPHPFPNLSHHDIYRRTVFTSALEGAWTGVGHHEMVWCHQVRWQVAKAVLEGGAPSNSEIENGLIFDKWLKDGHNIPAEYESLYDRSRNIALNHNNPYETVPVDSRLSVKNPRNSRMYLLPVIPSQNSVTFVLFLSQGSIPPVSPRNSLPLRVAVHICTSGPPTEDDVPKCKALQPTTLKLIPNPSPGMTFPLPGEGSDESEGVVLFETDIQPPTSGDGKRWVGVQLEDADGRGWVVAGINPDQDIKSDVGILDLLRGSLSLTIPDSEALRTRIYLANLPSSALLVYRLSPKMTPSSSSCSDYLLPPLLVHASDPPETHYFAAAHPQFRPIQLHTHSSAPYILNHARSRGLNLTVYSSGCGSDVLSFEIGLDWWASLGRLAMRFPVTLACWSIGVVALLVFEAWRKGDQGSPIPSVSVALGDFTTTRLPTALVCCLVVASLPLPKTYYLGGGWEPLLIPFAPILLLCATGLVCLSWLALVVLMWPLGKIGASFFGSWHEKVGKRGRSAIVLLVVASTFIFLPWQVAYLGCWIALVYICAARFMRRPFPGSTPSIAPSPSENYTTAKSWGLPKETQIKSFERLRCDGQDIDHHNQHMLLLMTWLLLLATPALAIWARTLWIAGPTAPFETDLSLLKAMPFALLVVSAPRTDAPLYVQRRIERRLVSVRWSFIVLVFIAFVLGPGRPYIIFDAARVCVWLVVVFRILPL